MNNLIEGFICEKLKSISLAAGGHNLCTSKRRSSISKFEARRLPLLSNITVKAGAGRVRTGHGIQATVFPPPTARREATGCWAEMRMEVASYEIPIIG